MKKKILIRSTLIYILLTYSTSFSQEIYIALNSLQNVNNNQIVNANFPEKQRSVIDNNKSYNIGLAYSIKLKNDKFIRFNYYRTNYNTQFSGINYFPNNRKIESCSYLKEIGNSLFIDFGKQIEWNKLIIKVGFGIGYSLNNNQTKGNSTTYYTNDTMTSKNISNAIAPAQHYSYLNNFIIFYYPVYKNFYCGIELYNSFYNFYSNGNATYDSQLLNSQNRVTQSSQSINKANMNEFKTSFLNPINIGIMYIIPSIKRKKENK